MVVVSSATWCCDSASITGASACKPPPAPLVLASFLAACMTADTVRGVMSVESRKSRTASLATVWWAPCCSKGTEEGKGG